MTAAESSLSVGDVIRISVELIRDIAQRPDFTTAHVRLREVRIEDDGTKVLVLDRIFPELTGAADDRH